MSKKKLASNFALRFGVTAVEKLTAIVLLPVLVGGLGVDGYGYYAMATSFALVFSGVLTLRLPLAVIRFYPEQRQDAGPVVLVGLIYWAALFGLGCILLPILAPSAAEYIFGKPGMGRLLAVSVGLGMSSMLYEFATITFRAENRFKFISMVDTVERIAFVALTAIALWWRKLPVEAICLLLLLTTCTKFLVAVGPAWRGLHWAWPASGLMRKMFIFSLPYLPYLASVWMLERSSFFALNKLSGPTEVGLFAIAFSLSGVLASAMGPLQTVLYPLVRKAYDAKAILAGQELLTMSVRAVLAVGAFGTISICFGVKHIFQLLSLHSAVPDRGLILVLSCGVVAGLIRHVYVTIINLEMNNRVLAWTTPIVAAASLPMYFLLIRHFGAVGAALALFIATLAQAIVLARYVPKALMPMPSRQFFVALIAASTAAVLIQWYLSGFTLLPYLAGLAISACAFLGLFYSLGAFTSAEKKEMFTILRLPQVGA